jgi:2-polyprenyl-3-methyl-5-hydroxy-6-metoxy-1,4-benzoquinol methylase
MPPEDSPNAQAMPPCLYCAGTAYEPLFDNVQDRLRYVPGRWGFRRCKGCGSAMLCPHPKPSELASFYPPIYGFAPDVVTQGPFRRWLARLEYSLFYQPQYEAQARRVLRGVRWDGTPGRRLLDVGCGRGLRLLAFRRRGFEVHGMDFQAGDVEYLNKQFGIPAVCSDFERLPQCFPPASFDLITAFHVLEHVPNVSTAIGNCFQLLKPGGWLVAGCPLLDSMQARLFRARWLGVTEAPRHLSLPSREGLKRVCIKAAFEAVTIQPDSVLNCAGMIGLSLLPGAATTKLGDGRLRVLLTRLVGAAVILLSVPWCLVENHLLCRPGAGLAFARKPAG